MPFSVVLDTCVLYPAHLRDILLRLAERGLYRALWSADIVEELQRNLIEAGFNPASIDRLIAEMGAAFPDAEVIGYRSLIDGLICDPKDRHVLAAAVRADAAAIVTFNIDDFPRSSSRTWASQSSASYLCAALTSTLQKSCRTSSFGARRRSCKAPTIATFGIASWSNDQAENERALGHRNIIEASDPPPAYREALARRRRPAPGAAGWATALTSSMPRRTCRAAESSSISLVDAASTVMGVPDERPFARLPDEITLTRDELAVVLFALDVVEEAAVEPAEAAKVTPAIRLLTAKLWPELGGLLGDDQE